MDTAEIFVLVVGIVVIGFIVWFFFGPRHISKAQRDRSGVQELEVVVKGGYAPDRIEVRQGQPVRLTFLRQESNPCTDEVVLPDFGIVRHLPQGEKTRIEFTPDKEGVFPFHCAMNMVRGQIIVKKS